ncbi:MAG: hypothetical protein KY460_07790 [Actinobacteria bacterium]|nr:hypothetical protein [Actinomycetota bacterium]
MFTTRTTTAIVRLDAVANLALAAVLAIAARPLTTALGLDGVAPLYLVAVLLAGNAVVLWQMARDGDPRPSELLRSAGIDLAFTIAVIAFALADPTAADPRLRWMLGGLAVAVGAVAAVKTLAAGHLIRHPVTAD